MSRRNQSQAAEDAPQDVRARVDEQIEDLTDSQETPAAERQEEQEHPSPPMPSSHASEHSDREVHRALSLMKDNISLLFDKLEAQEKRHETTRQELLGVTQELRATCDLMQQVIGRHDEQTENLGMQTAALAQAEMQLRALHQTLREHLSKHQHQ